jgi:glycosyltransferase involved in cell wall biosynthesis
MRILLINSEYPPVGGGASNASAFLARHLAELGQEVTVMTCQFSDLPSNEQQGDVRVWRIPARRKRQDSSGAFEQLIFLFIGSLWGIWLARKWKPDVVLAFFGAPSGIVSLVLKVFFGIPYVVSLRGGDVPGFRPYDFALYHKLLGPILHVVWRKAAFVVANSEGLKDLGQKFDSKVKIQVIPNGVDVDRFNPAGRVWRPARLLIVGRVVYQKGIDILLNALAGLKELEWSLSVVGDGPKRKELETQTKDLGLANRVKFLGWRDKDQLTEIYRQGNLFVYPSRDEGMPNVVLEAMASGLPVLASQIAGNEELVVPPETGLLVPPEDVENLRNGLRQLIPDADQRQSMGYAGRERVTANYTWRKVSKRNLELLQRAVEKN